MNLCENNPCTNPRHPGMVWCLRCVNHLAEERHQEDKIRWAREAAEVKKETEEEAEKEGAL